MEKTILANLIENEKYVRKVFPYLKEEYFREISDKITFKLISQFINKYGELPTKESLYIDLANIQNINEVQFEEVKNTVHELHADRNTKTEWLIDTTEKFCKDQALHNAIMKSIEIFDGNTKLSKENIPSLLQEALQVSFDNSIGLDFMEDAEERWKYYHEQRHHIPTGIDLLDKITNGGIMEKATYCFMAPSGVGKSLILCALASNILLQQKNVLYISMEMGEEQIGERIDANLMDIDLGTLQNIPWETFEKKFNKVKENTKGKLIIKEYPQNSASAATFRSLIEELKIKKNFVPDVLIIDYLNICASFRYKPGSVNSYGMVKAITEEIRGLASEYSVPVLTATQVNRSASKSMELEMEDVADSYGLVMTTDLLIGVSQDEEFDKRNQYLFKQVKNRYYPLAKPRRFVVGVDKSKMKLYNIDPEITTLYEGPEKEKDNGPTLWPSEDVWNLRENKIEGFE
jgi:replicative DNA helicase